MRRRLLAAGLLALLALGSLTIWLVDHLERVPVSVREAPQAEARRNPYLALERLTAGMGGRLRRQSDARVLDDPPAGATLFLDRQRAHLLPPERLRRLLAWVAAGGHLIAVAEDSQLADPLLDSVGVGRATGAVAEMPRRPASISVQPPGGSRPLQVAASWQKLSATARQPAWSAGEDGQEAQMLQFRIGEGRLTVASELDQQLGNRRIGELDHAEFFWTLIGGDEGSPPPQVLLLSRLQMPTLFEWLAENARAAAFAALLLLLLWLWRIVPRFGGLQAEPAPSRRELREHLAAVGRYLWRCGQLAALLPPAREHFRHRLGQRRPGIAGQAPAAQASQLAALSGLPPARITAALAGHADGPHAFTDALRTLRELERIL
ncbi:DUF4350 domain-containing protein [Accumulibacter sp.]|uniref:DUF4350 domain-containing protein n=1 Tax=Accumulibacter sp. TaxID=2053492 RepID=UPI0025CBE1A4|nr:DUF4350 domain-containing protein [Accumulibacter sp.]MCM8611442.1 DUF4350 domain-containing protein [Accumulibacter sp.]MCM8635360.1 DUF4350 domain-containing protein [Accumulibacter sp.]MCM8638797.1 DUF4350 domain-containing protein [Accumulibacter sp.]